MLLGNYNVFLKCPVTFTGGDSTSGIVGLRQNWNGAGVSRNRFYGENWITDVADKCGVPSNYAAPYAWNLPPHSGGIGSNVGMQTTGTLTSSMAAGKALEAALSGSGTISSATVQLVVSMVANLEASGTITNAQAVAILQMTASLNGSGDVTATLRAIGHLISSITADASMSPTMNATANMEADITPFTTLSPESLAASVWNTIAADYNESGTMGNKLNGAGSAGDPWTTDLDAYTTDGTAGKILKDAKNKAAAAAALSA
jgi:hypothetical protein